MSKYLISGLIFHFFSCLYEKKTSNPSLKKRSPDISLQHKNRASNKFSKKNFCTWPKIRLALKGIIIIIIMIMIIIVIMIIMIVVKPYRKKKHNFSNMWTR